MMKLDPPRGPAALSNTETSNYTLTSDALLTGVYTTAGGFTLNLGYSLQGSFSYAKDLVRLETYGHGGGSGRYTLACADAGTYALSATGSYVNGAYNFGPPKACFSGYVLVLTRRGWVRWDCLTPLDEVACLDENDPFGLIVWKRVEEIFKTFGSLWNVHLEDGNVLPTTPEHLIYTMQKGWIEAQCLERGDLLLTEQKEWKTVQEVYDTGEWEDVYNCRVEDYHTYFVGLEGWGYGVWAHNRYEQARVPKGDPSGKGGTWLSKTGKEKPPGRSFEDKARDALGLPKGKKLSSKTDKGEKYNTVPDAERPNNGPVVEIKDRARVNLNPQLQAQINSGRGVELIGRPDTKVSKNVIRAIGGKRHIKVFDPQTGLFSNYV